MRPVAISGFHQLPHVQGDTLHDEATMVQAVVSGALSDAGLARDRIGFWCSGSSDYIMGRPFSFVAALDGIGAWPPVSESHVEMDGAWALYEAWLHLQMGHVDAALVYAFGKGSLGNVDAVLTMQLDPYFMAPLAPTPLALAALQARMLLDQGQATEADFAAIVAERVATGMDNPNTPDVAQHLAANASPADLLARPTVASPLRAHDAGPWTDGAAAIVLTADDLATSAPRGAAWITGLEHRIDTHALGTRNLSRCPSATQACIAAGAHDRPIDLAELHAPTSAQEIVLRRALCLETDTVISPSGGALAAHTPMVAGLVRFGEAAARIRAGKAHRALAHATSGPCLQQNLVGILDMEAP